MDTTNWSQDEINNHNKLMKEALVLARKEAMYRKSVSESIDDYIKGIQKSNKLKKEYLANLKKQEKFEDELAKAEALNNKDDIAAARVKLDTILKTNAALKSQYQEMNKVLDSVNKKQMLGAKLGAEGLKAISKIPNVLQQGLGKLKDLGLFDMDKSIKMSALSMGLLGKQADGFRGNIKAAAWEASQVGVSIEDLSAMQSAYSEELGRTVILSQQASVAMAKMATDTQLGVEGAGRLTAEFNSQGLSAEQTVKFMNETMDSSHKMGLNAAKVIKNIAGNIKMLNRYNFKNGIDGLAKMAKTAAKLGVSMEFAGGFADKLFDVEGAVDMSAQLQVMGGEWSKLADPFQLMYKARNDIQGLTEDLGNAASASAHLNSEGEIEIAAMEMHRLRIIAQQTGISYDELTEAGKRAFKLKKIQTQVQFTMNDDAKEFLANNAELDKNGKAYIQVGADKKFLGMLGTSGNQFVKDQMALKESAGERTKAAQTFDEALSNTFMGIKQFLLPIIEVINKDLMPKLRSFVEKFTAEQWGEKLGKLAETVGGLITAVAGFVIDNPITTAFLVGAGFLADKAMWLLNGTILAAGFNASASINGGGVGSTLGKGLGKVGGLAGGGIGRGAMMAGGAGLAGFGVSALTDATTDPGSAWNIAGKAAGGALQGAAMGALLGPIGAGVGALIGGLAGGASAYYSGTETRDGLFTSPLHDGKLPAIGKNLGSDFSKGRGIIQGGKITPIDNKDDLMAMKKGGVVDNVLSSSKQNVNRIEFSNITIDGEIRIVSPGNPGLSIDLMKDQNFRRDITRTIQVELEKNKVGGKNRG